MEEEGEPERRAVQAGEQHLCVRPLPAERRGEVRDAGAQRVLEVLVLRQLADELEHQRHLVRGRGADVDARLAHPVLCRPSAMPPTVASRALKRSRSSRAPARQRRSRSTCMRWIGSR